MFKLTVEQILASIAVLTSEEKAELQAKLPTVLEPIMTSGASQEVQTQSLGNITISGNGTTFGTNQIKSGGDSNVSLKGTNNSVKNDDLKEALLLLANLKQEVVASHGLNLNHKDVVIERAIGTLEQELQSKQPNRNLIEHTIESLKKGLEGVQTLAEPVKKVADLLANVWMSP